MTVAELIAALEMVADKTLPVCYFYELCPEEITQVSIEPKGPFPGVFVS